MADESHPIVLAVGDRMRFSTALLRQIHEEPEEIVTVERIVLEPDGVKEIWLTRAERPT